jgi:ABC-type phosphate transport system substrate-binding protein
MPAFKQKLARIGATAGVLVGSTAAMFAIGGINAGAAAAAVPCVETTPKINIQGQGSSLQRIAQEFSWTGREVKKGVANVPAGSALPNTTLTGAGYANKCSASNAATVTYTSTSSGSGLGVFGFNGAALELKEGTMAFIGTDDAPTTTQIGNAETKSTTKPLIVPVAETAISVPVHPPAGCTLTGSTTVGISWVELNKIFAGTLKNWSEVAGISSGCTGAITRVVRSDASGTTYQFKNYLSELESHGGTGPGCSLGTWASLEAIGTENKPNITWPECSGTTTVKRAEGGGGVAKFVKENAGTIGYAALPDAKGEGAAVASLQNGETKGKTFALPESGTKANCGGRQYEVPTAGQVGSGHTGIAVDWSTKFGGKPTIGSPFYPDCTLTYDVGWVNYQKAGYGTGSSSTVGKVAREYILNYELSTEGQSAIESRYYVGLPSSATETKFDVLGAAKLAAEHIASE